MSGAQQLLAGGSSSSVTYVDDVFSTYLYTGNGSTQTITTGIDLTGGGLLWIKQRSPNSPRYNNLFDPITRTWLYSSTTDAESGPNSARVSAVSSTGFSLGSNTDVNDNTCPTVAWSFKKAAKFFDVVTYTGNGSTQTINHNLGVAPGMIIVKQYSVAGEAWCVYHRSLTSAYYLLLNSTMAQSSTNIVNRWGNNSTTVEPTSTQFTVGSNPEVNANSTSYVAYLFAHDTEADGIIQCGSFTGGSAGSVNLGWEPQYLMLKRAGGGTESWFMFDTMRGLVVDGGSGSGDKYLYANTSDAEAGTFGIDPTATGFNFSTGWGATTYIYLAIRRPNKPPTSGTQVFTPFSAGNNVVTEGPVFNGTFPIDFVLLGDRSGANKHQGYSRLTGSYYLNTTSTGAEAVANMYFDSMISLRRSGSADFTGQYGYQFRRAPGVFDVVCDTGTGAAKNESHNLAAIPEMMIRKKRSAATASDWRVYHKDVGAGNYLNLNDTGAANPSADLWNNTTPTASVFSVGSTSSVNLSSATFVTYLFATLAGISKVGSYTGNGSSQTINCGFTSGARFVLIKRTDSTGDWYVYDTARGINAGNDPHLSLNTTAAEVNTSDDIDSDNSGFIVNQNATTNLNVNTATYIFLAFA